MGILGLSKLIADVAPEAIKEQELKHYFGKSLSVLRLILCFLTINYDPRIFLHISDKIV